MSDQSNVALLTHVIAAHLPGKPAEKNSEANLSVHNVIQRSHYDGMDTIGKLLSRVGYGMADRVDDQQIQVSKQYINHAVDTVVGQSPTLSTDLRGLTDSFQTARHFGGVKQFTKSTPLYSPSPALQQSTTQFNNVVLTVTLHRPKFEDSIDDESWFRVSYTMSRVKTPCNDQPDGHQCEDCNPMTLSSGNLSPYIAMNPDQTFKWKLQYQNVALHVPDRDHSECTGAATETDACGIPVGAWDPPVSAPTMSFISMPTEPHGEAYDLPNPHGLEVLKVIGLPGPVEWRGKWDPTWPTPEAGDVSARSVQTAELVAETRGAAKRPMEKLRINHHGPSNCRMNNHFISMATLTAAHSFKCVAKAIGEFHEPLPEHHRSSALRRKVLLNLRDIFFGDKIPMPFMHFDMWKVMGIAE